MSRASQSAVIAAGVCLRAASSSSLYLGILCTGSISSVSSGVPQPCSQRSSSAVRRLLRFRASSVRSASGYPPTYGRYILKKGVYRSTTAMIPPCPARLAPETAEGTLSDLTKSEAIVAYGIHVLEL